MAKKQQEPRFDIHPRWIKSGAVFLTGIVGILVFIYFENVNRQEQIDRQLSKDTAVASWYVKTRDAINEAASRFEAREPEGSAPTSQEAIALWYGTVAKRIPAEPGSGRPLLAVELTEARLMAGLKGRQDSSKNVYISTRNTNVTGDSIAVGDQWLFSVWRDENGNNRTHSASLYRPASP